MRADLYRNLAEVEDAHWWFRSRRRIVVDLLASLGRRAGGTARILDVGAGTGATTAALSVLGSVDALENAPVALEFLRRRPGVNVVVGELPNAELPSATYKIVTALDVLEHIEDDRAALGDMARVLVPGGHLLLTVPAHPWLWTNFDEACHHFRRYRPSELEALVRDVGLEIRFSSPFQTLLFPLFVVDRLTHRVVPRRAEVTVPPRPLNRILEAVFSIESLWLTRGRSAPFGSSQLVLARLPATRGA